MTTMYYLLLLKALNSGYKSDADISSQDFRLQLLEGVEERHDNHLDEDIGAINNMRGGVASGDIPS